MGNPHLKISRFSKRHLPLIQASRTGSITSTSQDEKVEPIAHYAANFDILSSLFEREDSNLHRNVAVPCSSGWMSRGPMAEGTGWGRKFNDPISVPDGRLLVSLRDAASYITALPEDEASAPEWQAATEALMLVVELTGPTMFARIGVMRALNRDHVREFNPARKDHHWGKRKLKRDQ
ncbi:MULTISPECIES: hypothetical protein [unclassified Bradyrhizobium]